MVTTRRAVRGPDLGLLRETVRREYHELDEREVAARATLGRLTMGFVRNFLEVTGGERV